MAEGDAKVNMSLDDIIKLDRKDKKRKVMVNGKGGGRKNRQGKGQPGPRGQSGPRGQPGLRGQPGPRGQRGNKGNNLRGRGANNMNKNVNAPKSQAWRLQRQQSNADFVAKRYNQNVGPKRLQNKQNVNKGNERKGQINSSRQGFAARRAPAAAGLRGGKTGMTRARSRNNIPGAKRFMDPPKGIKRVSSLPNLRDPNSVYNRLGYQSPAQVAYRNRVKRAKQLLLQRQSQRLVPNDLVPRLAKSLSLLKQRVLETRQRMLTTQRGFNAGGLRSDQILRAQRRQQYNQKLLRMSAARVNPNPNVNFMCTLGDEYGPRQRSRSMSRGGSMRGRRQMSRGRSPYRQNPQNFNQHLPRAPLFRRSRSRSSSRSRSRTRTVPLIHSNTNVDDRTFSEVMYSVSNNLGVTGRTLNDRFTF
ncbi:serine/arginine repetitive matrix protein 2 [Diachasma alloeum]|uniref:serine/arginine repetitive matrix protein 2 n=1 Tax=Diachasma alloeum TaxID=454923 RepID=UPI0007384046|nr:serine/arginine repetitive matrix protein 2 [Diachasma alloeum]